VNSFLLQGINIERLHKKKHTAQSKICRLAQFQHRHTEWNFFENQKKFSHFLLSFSQKVLLLSAFYCFCVYIHFSSSSFCRKIKHNKHEKFSRTTYNTKKISAGISLLFAEKFIAPYFHSSFFRTCVKIDFTQLSKMRLKTKTFEV
jgi:hypothetical protein